MNTSFMPDWLRRDLAWLSIECGLLAKNPQSLDLIKETSLKLLSGEILLNENLLSTLAKKRNGPLGRYFEALVQAVISLSPNVSQYYANVIVMDGKRTAGELDLLYKCRDDWIHLEVAVKYYIGVGDTKNPYNWHGPAARDTLGRKLDKLFDHQVNLPVTDAGKITLSDLNIPEVYSEALILGKLFHFILDWQSSHLEIPDIIAENHPYGWWGRLEDISTLTKDTDTSWMFLQKRDWLSSVPLSIADTIGWPEMLEILKLELVKGPVMLASFSDGKEINRGFVVPNKWQPIQ